jgi:hypothetical protein
MKKLYYIIDLSVNRTDLHYIYFAKNSNLDLTKNIKEAKTFTTEEIINMKDILTIKEDRLYVIPVGKISNMTEINIRYNNRNIMNLGKAHETNISNL